MARSEARRLDLLPFYGFVCKVCLEANPKNINLLTTKCSHTHTPTTELEHVHVAISDGMLERIRPLPKKLSPGKKFIRCKSCSRGNHCTYAHSKAELNAWNAQLAESEDNGKSEKIWMRTPIRPLPNRLPPALCGSFYRGDNCTYAHRKAKQEETEVLPQPKQKRRSTRVSDSDSDSEVMFTSPVQYNDLHGHSQEKARIPQIQVNSPQTAARQHKISDSGTTNSLSSQNGTYSECVEAEGYSALVAHGHRDIFVNTKTFKRVTTPPHLREVVRRQERELAGTFRISPHTDDSILPSLNKQTSSSTGAKAASRLDEYVDAKQIGEGGFGVVFHVKHKVDQGDYALKMIRLSDNPKQQKKVLGEVTTLAQLNHSHIVRYFNSWMEKAPDGWREKKVWSKLKSSDSSSMEYKTDTLPTTSTNTRVVSADHEASSHTADSVVSSRDGADPPSGPSEFKILKISTLQPTLPLDPPTCLFIQTELCERGTLHTWLHETCEEESRTKSQVLRFFKQILEALVYIHKKGFVHRDLKPSNVFFSRTEDGLKIGDFGLVRTVAMPNGAPTGVDTTHGSADSYSKGSMQAGTFLYMSPEQVKGENCDEKSDMFALGIILFELHYYITMEARNQVLSALRKLKFPSKFEDNFLNVTRIVKLLLATNPAERPTANELTKNSSLRNLSKKVKKKQRALVPVL